MELGKAITDFGESRFIDTHASELNNSLCCSQTSPTESTELVVQILLPVCKQWEFVQAINLELAPKGGEAC